MPVNILVICYIICIAHNTVAILNVIGCYEDTSVTHVSVDSIEGVIITLCCNYW